MNQIIPLCPTAILDFPQIPFDILLLLWGNGSYHPVLSMGQPVKRALLLELKSLFSRFTVVRGVGEKWRSLVNQTAS